MHVGCFWIYFVPRSVAWWPKIYTVWHDDKAMEVFPMISRSLLRKPLLSCFALEQQLCIVGENVRWRLWIGVPGIGL